MAEEKKTILLNGGREVSVTLVTKAHDYLNQLLGEASTKTGLATLRVVKNTTGKPFVAVLIGGKHVGFLPDSEAKSLFAVLADCERDGVVAQVKGVVTAATDGWGMSVLTVSLGAASESLRGQRPVTAIPVLGDVVHCRNCGTKNSGASELCSSCGSALKAVRSFAEEPSRLEGRSRFSEEVGGATLDSSRNHHVARRTSPERNPRHQDDFGDCEHIVVPPPRLTVTEDAVVGTSPMDLPGLCVKCGADAAGGERIHKHRYMQPFGRGQGSWPYRVLALFFLLAGIVIAVPLLFVHGRGFMEINYSLCRKCIWARRRKVLYRTGIWLLLLVALPALTVAIDGWSWIAVWLASALFCLGWLYPVHAARDHIWVSERKDQVFTVKGTSEAFRKAMKDYGNGPSQPDSLHDPGA